MLSIRNSVVATAAAILISATSLVAQAPAGAAPVGGFPQGVRMRAPATFDFADNTGFTSLYDGTTKGWDFDSKLWDINDGAIHIAATCEKPTGTVYAVSATGEYGDFILKYEMKGTGNINGGMQFHSYVAADPATTGVKFPPRQPRPTPPPGAAGAAARPPRPPACANPGTAPTRESQAKWDMAGPQADFDRNNNFSAMNYEQGGRSIMATPGYSLFADASGVKATAQIATKDQLDSWFHKDDWNQFMIVCMGHSTSIFMNGHLVTQLIDTDASHFRNSGKFAIESESTGDLWVKNVSVKKL